MSATKVTKAESKYPVIHIASYGVTEARRLAQSVSKNMKNVRVVDLQAIWLDQAKKHLKAADKQDEAYESTNSKEVDEQVRASIAAAKGPVVLVGAVTGGKLFRDVVTHRLIIRSDAAELYRSQAIETTETIKANADKIISIFRNKKLSPEAQRIEACNHLAITQLNFDESYQSFTAMLESVYATATKNKYIGGTFDETLSAVAAVIMQGE